MYFCIHYFDNSQIEEEHSKSQLTAESGGTIKSSRSAVVPENKQLLVNPNCPVGILLDYVCKETGVNKEADYDFCNTETGEFVGIKQYQQYNYATNLFVPKQIYVIILFESIADQKQLSIQVILINTIAGDENGVLVKYEPYVNKLTRIYTDIIIRIKRYLTTTKRRSSGTKKYRRGSTGSTNSNSDSVTTNRRKSNKQGSIISKRS